MIVFKLILFTLFISVSQCRIPDKVNCANKECDGPISKAKTLLSYTSPDADLISFRGNSEAIVYMKSAGTNSDLWFVSINGKYGFVNKKFIREYKIIEKNLQLVPFEPKNLGNVQPDKVQHPHEVFEGTTIYTTEAAVNTEQQDSSTESPIVSSNDNLTPSLNSATEPPNQIVDSSVANDPSSDNNEVNVINKHQMDENEKSVEPKSDEPSMLTEIPTQTEALVISSEVNDIVESARTTESIEKKDINYSELNEPSDNTQINQELPKEIPPESLPPQQILTTGSGTLKSESIIEVLEKQDYLQNTLTESEQSDSKEQNTSLLNNNQENMQESQETSTEITDMPNGNSSNDPAVKLSEKLVDSSSNQPVASPTTEPAGSTTEKPLVNPTNDPVVPPINEPVVPPINEPAVPSINEPVVEQIHQAIPQTYNNINTDNQYSTVSSVNTIENENIALMLEPVSSPSTETLPTVEPIPAPSKEPLPAAEPLLSVLTVTVPPTTETIPPLFPYENTQPVQTPETIPPIMNMEAPPTTEIPPQELSSIFSYTTPTPYSPDVSNNNYGTPESAPTADTPLSPDANVEDIIAALPDAPEDSTTTEAPVQDENTEGFFSNMYSTVSEIWPSSTESPESLYNTEYPTYESEKADGDEGFSFMKYVMSTYYSIMGTSEESKALFASVGETCFTDEYCDGTSNDGSNRLLTFLLTTASSVLLFTLGYYYIDNRRQDGRLIGTINSLQRDLLFATKECEILKEELATTKNKLAGIEDSSFGMDDMVLSLKEEIKELKATNDRLRNSLDDNEKLLRVSENTAGELQNTLSEVENTLSELLAERANSEEQIVELNGKIQAFEEELISVSRERDNFQLKYVSAETMLEEFKKQKKQFEEVNQQITEAKNTIDLQKHEIEALKEAIKELKSGMSADVDVTSFIDHAEIKAKLSKALQEKTSFVTKFETEYKERTRLAEELKVTQETLNTTSQSASEAMTRLEVLGKYFQEREGELLKELSAKESLWLSKQGESASTVEKIELLQQEVQRYKEKCDALTLELAEQESSRRSALSEVETRAHSAWLEARSAKREADAARDEAAALRRKLASLSVADGAVSPHHKVSSPLEHLDTSVIPPPLPPMFLPPPLLPPLPRPPPLGRLPSPHPPRYGDRRYSPDSRYSPESRYSPDSRYSPETVRYSPDTRYSPRSRRSPYSPRSRRRSRSRERYEDSRLPRSRNGPAPPPDTETEYHSDSPTRQPRRRRTYSRHSGPSSGSGCSSESDK